MGTASWKINDKYGKDVFGNDLKVGDEVAYCEPGYSELKTGIIGKLTPKGATIYTPHPEIVDENDEPYISKTPRLYNQLSLKHKRD